jgi:RNA polymerase sigma-70 factor (ECF subfamily)
MPTLAVGVSLGGEGRIDATSNREGVWAAVLAVAHSTRSENTRAVIVGPSRGQLTVVEPPRFSQIPQAPGVTNRGRTRFTGVVATIADTWMTTVDRPAPSPSSLPAPQDEVLRLFSEQGPAVFRFCRSMLRTPEEAEDVVQDTFLKLLRHLEASGDRSNLRAWLFTVAANGCRDRLRVRSRWLPWSAETDRRTAPEPDERPDLAAARRALQALGHRDRLLLSLKAQGLSYAEIARAADIRPVSVGRLLARAVDRWKRAL